MGIDTAAAQLLLLARSKSDFNPSRGIIFGHQKNYVGPLLKKSIRRNLDTDSGNLESEYADGFFQTLGILQLDVLDISEYEGANVIHDLNLELPPTMKQYSLVIDIGTLEHVFDIAQGLQNIKDLCLPGGYVLMLSPANNWLGHGFYQLSPELLFRNFDESLGWEVEDMYLVRKNFFRSAWYPIIDPKVKQMRGNTRSKGSTYVGVIARKKKNSELAAQVQQSDYVNAWEKQSISRAGKIYLGLPKSLRLLLDVTLMELLTRRRGKLSRQRFYWKDGRLYLR